MLQSLLQKYSKRQFGVCSSPTYTSSLGKELKYHKRQFVDCSRQASANQCAIRDHVLHQVCFWSNRLDLKYPQTAVCGIRGVVSPECVG